MKQELIDNNYLFVPNFLPKNDCVHLSRAFKEFCEENNVAGDEQAPYSSSIYNFLPFLEILTQAVPSVCHLIEESVFPTYTYARVYRRGDDLKRHKDRPACEISLTVNLYQDKVWPIYVKTPSGEEKSVSLNTGDAMLYLGCEAEHYRLEMNQEETVQLFLHYVRARGENNWAIFDSRKEENKISRYVVSDKPRVVKQNTTKTMGWFL